MKLTAPHSYHILALEDEEKDRDNIREDHAKTGIELDIVPSVDQFEGKVEAARAQGKRYDAFSIDAFMGEINTLGGIRRFLHEQKSLLPVIVYTDKGKNVEAELATWQNAEYVSKTDRQSYRTSIQRDGKRGRLVQIMECLEEMGVTRLPIKLEHLYVLSEPQIAETEERIIFMARNELRRVLLDPKLAFEELPCPPQELRSLLIASGKWIPFDADAYLLLPWSEKLRFLLNYAEVTTINLSNILGISEDAARAYLTKEQKKDPSVSDHKQSLLYLMGFLLRVAKDEPELVRAYWTDPKFFKGSKEQPPWLGKGLEAYLVANGPQALSICCIWIRSH